MLTPVLNLGTDVVEVIFGRPALCCDGLPERDPSDLAEVQPGDDLQLLEAWEFGGVS